MSMYSKNDIGMRGGLLVRFATARLSRPEVQTQAKTDIWIQISAPCGGRRVVDNIWHVVLPKRVRAPYSP